MALIDQIKVRHGTQLLVELTRNDPSATTIDDTVLQAACDDAVGVFERFTGVAFDFNQIHHVPVLIPGVLYYLESYKMRNSSISNDYKSEFYAGCKSFLNKTYISPATTSNLKTVRDVLDSLPDLHRKNFNSRNVKGRVELTNEDS